jgi:hypothetical protein
MGDERPKDAKNGWDDNIVRIEPAKKFITQREKLVEQTYLLPINIMSSCILYIFKILLTKS